MAILTKRHWCTTLICYKFVSDFKNLRYGRMDARSGARSGVVEKGSMTDKSG